MQSKSSKSRYLLCVPRGGLNDMLVQIDMCWSYAERYGRALIINARNSGLHDDLSRYFDTAKHEPSVQLALDGARQAELDALSVRPACVAGRLGAYEVEIRDGNFSEAATGEPLTFDRSCDHPEELLVHDQCGGGKDSIYALARLRFSPWAARTIRAAIDPIGTDYVGVHVRHSDLTTDYRTFFADIAPRVSGRRVLICSDSAECIAFAKSFLSRSDVFTVTETPDTNGRPLHEAGPLPISVEAANINLLTDLMALAGARKVLAATPQGVKYSGYGRLARTISRRPGLADALLGRKSPASALWASWNRAPPAVRAVVRAVAKP